MLIMRIISRNKLKKKIANIDFLTVVCKCNYFNKRFTKSTFLYMRATIHHKSFYNVTNLQR